MRNALRMRPDRVLLGEVRSHEVMDMLQAMNTGHDGCMSTVHANNPRDALLRLEMLSGFAGYQGDEQTLKHMIATALDLIVQVGRMTDGRRRILAVSEVLGVQDGRIVTNELYVFHPDSNRFEATGLTPASPKLRTNEDLQAVKFHRSW
jgi:pilus assembly protein CpaF